MSKTRKRKKKRKRNQLENSQKVTEEDLLVDDRRKYPSLALFLAKNTAVSNHSKWAHWFFICRFGQF